MMVNSTQVLYFTLAAYSDTGLMKYLLFMVLMCLYVCILCVNVLLIVVICTNRSLHEPMYLFLCSLFVNELYGSTGLFPFLLLQVLSDVHTVSVPWCFLQLFCLHTYGSVEFTNLAIMSYDRYVAICCPLHYNTRMTFRKVTTFIAVTWFLCFLAVVGTTSLSAPLQLCGNVINKVYCDNFSVVKLACSDTTANNVYGLIATFITISCTVSLILYTYMKILRVCFSGSRETRQKAVSTCTPHLASLINFSVGGCFEILQSRFNMSRLPITLRIILSLYWLICQPLFNPLLYGLKLSKIRNTCKQVLVWKL